MRIFGSKPGIKRTRPLVLVADDNSQLSEMLCELLAALNCDTVSAENGEAALKLVADKKPDLVLLDVMMPKMSGISVIRTLKQNSDTKAIPVMMVSGEQKGNDLDMAFNLGAVDYVIKPVRKTEFESKVRAILSSIGFSPAH